MFYDTTPAVLLWSISLVLALGSIAVFAGLILTRAFRDARDARRQQRATKLRQMLLVHLETPLSELDETFALRTGDLEILADLTQEILRTFSGNMREKILSFITILKIENWIRDRALGGRTSNRAAAIQLLGYLPQDPNRITVLHQCLESGNQYLQYVTCESLSRFARAEDFTPVLAALEGITDLSPMKIAEIFKRYRLPVGRQFLDLALSEKHATNIRLAAIEAISDNSIQGNQAVLETLCRDDDDAIGAAAFAALSRTGRAVEVGLIEYGSRHRFWKVRLEAARLASQTKRLAAEALQDLLADEHWLVSIEVAKTLFGFGAPGRRTLSMIAGQSGRSGKRASAFLAETVGRGLG